MWKALACEGAMREYAQACIDCALTHESVNTTRSMCAPAGAWVHWLLCGCWVACCCRKKSRYRAIPGTFGQFNLLVRRAGVKWVRNWGIKFLDVCLFAAAALIIGGHLFPLVLV